MTPLHLAILGGHPGMVRRLLDAGADPRIKDSLHDADAIGWASFFRQEDVVRMLEAHAAGGPHPSSPRSKGPRSRDA